MKLVNINKRNFLITFAAILTATFFVKQSKFFSKIVTFDKELYFSSFCSLIDSNEEFVSNYNSNNQKKKLLTLTAVQPNLKYGVVRVPPPIPNMVLMVPVKKENILIY